MDNEPPARIFEIDKVGNKEFSWSGLILHITDVQSLEKINRRAARFFTSI